MKTYYGSKAIREVQKEYSLSHIPRPMALLIEHEGYTTGEYLDDKGIPTKGVGQTGIFINMPFPQVYEKFLGLARSLTPQFNHLPEEAQGAILLATYRGDWSMSRRTRKLFDQGKYQEASKEFLNNKEYNERKMKNPQDGVVKRLEYIAQVIASLEENKEENT